MSLLAVSVPGFVLLQGVITGLNFGLLALGFVLIYRTNRVLNFAQAQLGVLAAVFLVKLNVDFGFDYWFALILALALAAVVAAISEIALRRIFNRSRVLVMVATIGLSQLFVALGALPFIRPKNVSSAFPLPIHVSFSIGNFIFGPGEVLTLIVAPVVALALSILVRFSRWGLDMRSMAENIDSSRLSGVWVRRTSTLTWVLAGLLSAFAAILYAPSQTNVLFQPLSPDLLVLALTAALMGAMVNLTVGFVAGVGIGVIYEVIQWNTQSTATQELILFALLVAVLIVRVAALRKGTRSGTFTTWLSGAVTVRRQRGAAREGVSRAGMWLALAGAALLPLVLNTSRTFLFSQVCVFAVVALSLTVLTGWAGQVSLGQFGLVAVGTLVAAHLGTSVPLVVIIVVGGLVASAVAVIVGLPALRIPGLYLAVSTLGFALFMEQSVLATPCIHLPLVNKEVCLGLPNPAGTLIPRPSFFGISLFSERAFAWFALGFLVVCVLIVRAWRDHGIARRLVSVRDNESGAAAVGTPVVVTKLLGFALSGFLAGMAGVCYGFAFGRVTTDTFDPSVSFLVISMVVIGGLGSVPGAILGAIYLIGLPAIFGTTPTIQFLTSGLGLLAFILYLPGGLAQLLEQFGDLCTAGLQRIVKPSILGQIGLRGATKPPPSMPATAAKSPAVSAGTLPPACLELVDVVVDFGGVRAVDEVSFTAEPGSIIGLIGSNGSGKTTTLDVISGLVVPTSGSVMLDGRPLGEFLPEERRSVGMIRSFQDCRLFPELTVREVLLCNQDAEHPVGVTSTSLDMPWARRREHQKQAIAQEVVGAFGLQRFLDHRIVELSTGTRRVVDLASIMLADPRILLLDEPTAGIAQREAEAFVPLLRKLQEVTKSTIILVEHDMPIVFALSSHVIMMEAGKVVSSGTPDEVSQDPRALAAYLGASQEALALSGPSAVALATHGEARES